MLVFPSKMKKNKILKSRTLNLETSKRTHGNFVMVATDNDKDLEHTFKSKLFRPQQMISMYVPRMIRPMNRKRIRINQKDFYVDMKEKTGGRLKIGKLMPLSYNGKNLTYNMVPEYSETLKMVSTLRKGVVLQKYMIEFFENLVEEKASETAYEKNYLVFPMVDYLDDFKASVFVKFETNNPLVLFLKSIKRDMINRAKFDKYDFIIFFNPNANALIAVDLKDPEFDKNFLVIFQRITRLNNFNNGTDALEEDGSGDIETEEAPADEEEQLENEKEKIKEIILTRVAKTIKAGNLTDFESANKDEQDLALTIDKKIEDYLTNKENQTKSFNELVDEIDNDTEIKIKAIKYVETKKISNSKLSQLSKNIDKELEVIQSIEDLDSEDDMIEADRFEVEDISDYVKVSSLSSLDEEYNKKQSKKDLTNILSGFSSSNYLPMTIESLKIDDTSNDFNQINTVFAKYRTDEGKLLSFALDMPKIVDKRHFFLNGNKKVITKQLVRLPIVKTKSDRVEITTNYNKVTIERTSGKLSRKNAYLLKILKEYAGNPNVEILYGSNEVINNEYTNDFEYEELSENISALRTSKYELLFNRENMKDEIEVREISSDFFKDSMTPFGMNRINDAIIYIENEKVFSVRNEKDSSVVEKISESLFDFMFDEVLKRDQAGKLPQIGKSFIYTNMSILGTTYPVFAVVGFMNGITDILKRYKVEYKLSEKKITNQSEYVEVKFKDQYLYYKDTIKNTLLLNVLYRMDTEEYDFEEFNLDQPYIDFFIEKLGQPIYIRDTLRINLNVMLDPVTREVLKDLKLPTDIIDLLLYANTLLEGNTYRPQNDIRNYRIRGNEVVNVMAYEIIAKAYIAYQRQKLNGRSVDALDIPRDILIKHLMKERNVNEHSTLNPVLEMENIANLSAKGFRGINLDDAFTLEVRSYDESMVGFISANSTPYSNAGVTRGMVYNPKITTVRGYIPEIDRTKLNPTELLSPAEMLSSFTSTQADPTRQAMQIGQTKHTMPVNKTHKQLVGSGVNKTMAFMISDDFAFKAKDDGVVKEINKETEVALLEYRNGNRDAIDLSEVMVKNSNSGFYIQQRFTMVYKEGEKFKKGDVLAFNPSFFSGKGKDIDYRPGTLAKVAIAAGDFAYEDSTIISDALSEKAASKVTMLKQVALGPNSVIHYIVKKNNEVKTGESLVEFTTSFQDPTTTDFLTSLSVSLGDEATELIGNEVVKSKYTGRIADIKIYYNKPIEELNESIQKLIKTYKSFYKKKKDSLGGIISSNVRIPSLEQQDADSKGKSKIGGEEYDGIMIEFYVEYYDQMMEGDKLTFSTALKGVISKRLTREESPITEHRPEEVVEAIVTPTGIISRMTMDVYSMIFSNKVLVELGKQIKEIIDDKG